MGLEQIVNTYEHYRTHTRTESITLLYVAGYPLGTEQCGAVRVALFV